MKKVFIVTLSYKGHKDTKELLDSLQEIKKDHFDPTVIVVDNFPLDPFKVNKNDYKNLNLKVIYNKENLGFSGGANVGIKYSLENGADYVLIINNDTYVDSEFINELIKTSEKDKSIGVVVPKIYFAKGFEFHKKYKENELGKVIWYAGGNIDWANVIGYNRGVDEIDMGQFDELTETEIASGCCLLIKKEVLEKIRGYDERYFLYYEDSDLSQRIKKAGYKLIYQPNARIWHKNAQSVGGSGSDLQDYFITRNRLIFGLEYAPIRSKIALIRESLMLILRGRKWQKRGIIDYFIRSFSKGSFPIK